MKKLIFIILILSTMTYAAENQKIIFSGSYSLNNEAGDADSAWLYMYYYATKVGSTKVTAEDLQWGGYYQHTHACTNDSADGWSGVWIFFDTYSNSTISVNDPATIASVRDSTIGDMIKISGDAAAADNFETMLDGTGGQVLSLKQLSVVNPAGDATIFKSTGGNGTGLNCEGNGTGAGFLAYNSGAGPGFYAVSISGFGAHLYGATGSGDGLYLQGNRYGLLAVGDTKDISATLDLNDLSGDFDHADFEADYYARVSDTMAVLVADSNIARYSKRDDYMADVTALALEASTTKIRDTLGTVFNYVDSIRTVIGLLDWTGEDSLIIYYAPVASCASSGVNACTLIVYDTTNSEAVNGVAVVVTASGGNYYIDRTDTDGTIIIGLNDGSYTATMNEGPYTAEVIDLTVTGPLTDTIFVEAPSFPAPASSDVVTCWADLVDGQGNPLVGAHVFFTLPALAVDTSTNNIVGNKTLMTISDSNGRVQKNLVMTKNIIPGYSWIATIEHSRMPTSARLQFSIDDTTTASYNFSDGDVLETEGVIR